MTAALAGTALATPAVSSSRPSPLLIRGLVKRYDDTEVVRGIDLELRAGECFTLLGPNGAGKTTTLRCALGLTAPSAGSIRLCGEAVPERAREARMRVGIVPQIDNLDPDFTCAENLLVYGRYFGLADAAIKARIPELLAFAGLENKRDARIQSLSGGMKRRLTLARALVNRPELLVLDEPTTGLDPQARHLIWDRLKQLIRSGTTVLLTTHFMDEAERLSDHLAILDNGRVLAGGSPREVIAEHIEPQVVEVFGDWTGHALPAGGGAAAWADAHAAALSDRFEISGETAFCYLHDAAPLLTHLATQPGLRYLHRPANLEDVFLKLTGRDLRD
ncbi:MAG: nodulation factor ABC transporter ATP-binding protein NodI [Betaproteobacteria bacterium HGW-Betaproteobacteria-13]|jgi:lipooligosaccharide transport system ATP-binding protein|nr:MAG: nodulation factor ABC transporter ATP-binding protein NodI [Betaproteobacteria bacterium HGW-Betaproteobacteria-19]PKO79345.1 MAG: nodulation factor ABC transporter ATP-binding protein NodI [Betaproteobacteria bacterium HGW-Betaproteobacteria-13]